jgi:large repetitive protein
MKLTFNYIKKNLLGFILVLFPIVASQYSNAQCGFQATCSSTNYLNFGMGSNGDAAKIEYDNFISCFHSTAARTANGTYEVWGENLANNGTGHVLVPTIMNSTNYPALTGDVLKVHLGSNFINEQGIVLTTTGLFAWSTEGIILHNNITSSSVFQKLTINSETDGLPAGVDPLDVKMIFTTDRTMAIVTCSGAVYVITQLGENAGRNLTGTLSGAAASQWYRVQESTAGNPDLSNVISVRGNRNTLFALKSDGTLWTWGAETYLGDNTPAASRTRATPMTLPSGNPIKMIGVTRNDGGSAASYYVLNADGNLYAMGNNAQRQLGDWTTSERRTWEQPRYSSAAGPVMSDIHWISPNEHDSRYAAINIINSDSTNYNWGDANGQMLGRGGTGTFNPGIPNGINALDKILAVETGGHTSMLVKKCEDFFGYVGHRTNGSMGDGTATNTNEPAYTFATAVVFICGATNLDVTITGAPTFGAGGLYCNGSSVDLIPSPSGGVLTLLSGPGSLAGTIMSFNGTGNTTIDVEYAVTVPGCPIAKTTTLTLLTEDCPPITVSLTGTTTITENAAGVATLTATLSAVASTPTVVTLTYTGTATNGTDYTPSSVTITIPAGSLTGTVTVDPTDDAIFEGSETVIADITNVTGGDGAIEDGTQTAIVTITDDETAPTVTLTGTTTIAENAAGVATLTATLSVATTTPTVVTLTYTGTASGADYVASSTTITIPAGSLTGTVTIDPTDDAIFEGSETVIADITNVTGGNGATENGVQTATVTITDDETAPTVTLTGTTTIAENAAGVATLTATLSVATTTPTDVTLTYTGTATNGTDYVASSTTITIPAGSLTGTVTIDPTDDAIFEGSETVIADITNVTGGNGATEDGTQTATVTITDDETAPTVTLTGTTTIAENAAGVATLTATLSVATITPTVVTLTYTGTATNGTDYVASSTTITIPAGSLTGTVTIDPTNDAIFEGSETVIADITNVTGGNGATEDGTQTATVTIIDANIPPVANDNSTSTNEDVSVVLPTIQMNDTDADGTVIVGTIDLNPLVGGQQLTFTDAQGTWTLNSTTGDVTFDPAPNFNGTATIQYTIDDNGGSTSNLANLIVNVTPINDAPSQGNETTTTTEDNTTPVTVDLNNNNIDPDGTTTVVTTIVSTTGGGTVVNNGDGTVDYTPAPNFNGIDTVIYTVCDQGLPLPAICVNDTLFVTVTAVNDAPSQGNETTTTTEDNTTPVTVDLNNNNIDPDGTTTVVTTIVSTTGGGTVVNNGDGTIDYTPAPNFNGIDTVIYTVCDQGLPLPAICVNDTLFVTVTAVNDAPSQGNETTTTTEDNTTPVTVDLNNNNIDPDGTTTVVTTIVSTSGGGTVVNNGDGTVDYTPAPNFNGIDTVIYTVCDQGLPLPAICVNDTLFVTVTAVNDAPVIDNEIITIPLNGTATGDLTDAGDSDIDGNLIVNTTPIDGPNNGNIAINPDGTFTYIPDTDFFGNDTIVVQICDDGSPLPAICVNDTIFIIVLPCDVSTVGLDCDGDGVTNGQELIDGTDPSNPCELIIANQNTTPTVDWNNDDCDNDGLTNGEEVTGIDDPTTPENPNGEITNPLNPDTDGDGVTDDQEAADGTDPNDPCDLILASQTVTPSAAWNNLDCDNDGSTNGEEIIEGTDPFNPDTDGDGVLDGTEIADGTNPNDPCDLVLASQTVTPSSAWNNLDCDNDGSTNGEEIIEGTDPLNPDTDGDGVLDGTEIADGTDPNDPCDLILASQTVTPVATWNNLDCDNDGSTNGEEIIEGTDPFNPDTDGDGVLDGTEIADGTNPNDPCDLVLASQSVTPSTAWNNLDCDNDGSTNGEEISEGTDPLNPDTDGDGVLDGTEIADGTDPNDPCDLILASQTVTPSAAWNSSDCDGDGISNGEEVTNGSDPLNVCSPNPCEINVPQAFTPDGDGINDFFVIAGIESIPDNVITIFNRWGNIVFTTKKYDNNWAGTTNVDLKIGGEDLPTGTYFYILKTGTEEYGVIKGYVYIQR